VGMGGRGGVGGGKGTLLMAIENLSH